MTTGLGVMLINLHNPVYIAETWWQLYDKHHPRRKAIATELGYFRGHRHRMRYAQMTARDLPIGSGIVEAACKTLVTQRMKRSGMRWRHEGGQAILTFRRSYKGAIQCRLGACLADLYQDGRTARQHCRLSCTATSTPSMSPKAPAW